MKNIFSHQAMPASPAIMESMDSPQILAGLQENESQNKTLQSISFASDFVSLKLGSAINESASFLLLDSTELLKVNSVKDFLSHLGCDEDSKVKVVSIFGNTGDGKSYTLNQTFFSGVEVFRTSDEQDACTLGVWAAYDSSSSVICLDTEGLLGASCNDNQRMRMLLKVLAVSDVVIYRCRSERLHTDMLTFLSSASRAYSQHFQASLAAHRSDSAAPLSALGPAVIVFHETRSTSPLTNNGRGGSSADEQLRAKFNQLKLDVSAFSSLIYVGIQTAEPPTNFSQFQRTVSRALHNSTVRSARSPVYVFNTLKMLNNKFSDAIKATNHLFPDEYFTCQSTCLSCHTRCSGSMGHETNCHFNSTTRCRYQEQFSNMKYLCKSCYLAGRETEVTPSYTPCYTSNSSVSKSGSWITGFARYAWAGYVIDCPHCGEIYRSRQFWYGNESPEVSAVRTEIVHVWPGVENLGQSNVISCQMVLDRVSEVSEAITNVTAQPTKILGQWAADQIAPSYWTPNEQIKVCCVCADELGCEASKHHCRSCGDGVCSKCSSRSRPVPEKGWNHPVRVCDKCFSPHQQCAQEDNEKTEVTARKVGEAVVTGLSSFASILTYPKSVIKNTARPTYWVPDCDARSCCVCGNEFPISSNGSSSRAGIHHCRDCGGPVCSKCSKGRAIVPHRGWTTPVRVCDSCISHLNPD